MLIYNILLLFYNNKLFNKFTLVVYIRKSPVIVHRRRLLSILEADFTISNETEVARLQPPHSCGLIFIVKTVCCEPWYIKYKTHWRLTRFAKKIGFVFDQVDQ